MCLCSVDLQKVTSGLALVNCTEFQRHGITKDTISARGIRIVVPIDTRADDYWLVSITFLLESCIPGEWCHAKVYKFIVYYFPINFFNVARFEKNEVGGACGAHGGGERCAQGYSGETRGKEAIGETQT